MADEEEDDYLTMALPTESPTPTTRETLTQTRLRKQRESELRGRPKSKAELAADQARKRDEALARSALEPENKGLRIMQKLGFEVGGRLGKKTSPASPATDTSTAGMASSGVAHENGNHAGQAEATATDERPAAPPATLGLLEPIALEMKTDRGGIGADSEKKRKFRAEVESRVEGEKRAKVEGEGFRERVAREREEKRVEGLVRAARGVAEGLEETDQEGDEAERRDGRGKRRRGPLSQVNVLWRGVVKERLVKERDRRLVHDFHTSLGDVARGLDPEMDADDRLALGTEVPDEDLDEEDEELDEFEALEDTVKLEKLVAYLRERWWYCFWCKYRYPDAEMEGCPGTEEDAHG